jgi:hypothetical protein
MKEDVPVFSWQEGYGAFGVSESHRQIIIEYMPDRRRITRSGRMSRNS